MKGSAFQIFILFFVVFFAFVGFAMPYPILVPLFLARDGGFLAPDSTEIFRTTVLGVVMAVYPIGQFLGAPILGQLSDRYGRKSVLSTSLLLAAIFYVFSGLALWGSHLYLLLITRFLSGFVEGNVGIAQSIASDISKGVAKVKNFAMINMGIDLGWIVGPLIGGGMADPEIFPHFGPDTPFFVAALLGLVNLTLVHFFLEETASRVQNEDDSLFSRLFLSFYIQLRRPDLCQLFNFSFFSFLAVFAFFNTFGFFLVRTYDFSSSELALACVYLSLPLIVGNWLSPHMVSFLGYRGGVSLSSICLGLFILLFVFWTVAPGSWVTIPLVGIAIALSQTVGSVVVSDAAGDERQGEVMGTYRALIVLAECLTAILGGMLAGFSVTLPLIFGALCAFWSLKFFKEWYDAHQGKLGGSSVRK